MIAFADAAVRSEPLDELRAQVIEAVGADGAAQAAATVAAFSGLVRVADGTGIPVDDGLAAASTGIRAELGLDDFNGADNTDLGRAGSAAFTDIGGLFRD